MLSYIAHQFQGYFLLQIYNGSQRTSFNIFATTIQFNIATAGIYNRFNS